MILSHLITRNGFTSRAKCNRKIMQIKWYTNVKYTEIDWKIDWGAHNHLNVTGTAQFIAVTNLYYHFVVWRPLIAMVRWSLARHNTIKVR